MDSEDEEITGMISRKRQRMLRETKKLSTTQRLERFVLVQLNAFHILQTSGNLEIFHQRNRLKRRVDK